MRRWIFGLGIPALLIAGYVGYWHYLETQLRDFVDGWIDDQRAAGLQVGHGTITTGGFPFTVRADIPAPSITSYVGQDTMSWQGESLRISFPPWDFLTYSFESPGEHLIAMVGSDSFAKWSVMAETATGRWGVGSNGAGDLVLDLADVSATDALGQRFALQSLAATVDFAAKDTPPDEPRLTATARVEGLGLPDAMTAPFPPVIESFNTEVRLISPVVPSSLPLLYLALRDYDGRIRFDDTTLRWGDLELATEGALHVDQDNYLAGQFPTRVVGYQETIAKLQEAGFVSGVEAVGLGALAGALASPGDDGRPVMALDIRLEDGKFKVQDATLLEMEPVPVAGAQS